MTKTITLRPATILDADVLLDWRNDPETREGSHNTAEPRRVEHIAWLSRSLGDPNRLLFVAEDDGVPVGTVRADFSEGVWVLSWTTAPRARGRGVAKRMVSLLARQISDPIRAEVKVGNIASTRVAEHAGMKFTREADGVLHYARVALK